MLAGDLFQEKKVGKKNKTLKPPYVISVIITTIDN